jgi:magnesium transporter
MRLAEPIRTWNSQVIALRSSALVMFRILPWNTDSKDVQFLAALISKGLLLTFTSLPRRQKDGINLRSIKYMTEPERITHGSASGALLAWLLFHVERTALHMREIRDDTLELDERMDEDPASVSFDEIKEVKDILLWAIAVADEQEESISRLKKAASDTAGLDFSKQKGTLGVLLATAQSTERVGFRVEKRIGDIRAAYESYQQDRINQRLAILTMLSAVFLPLSLMAGIWGMNFENMPGLERENAYFFALGAMGAVAATSLFIFWRTGWFGC